MTLHKIDSEKLRDLYQLPLVVQEKVDLAVYCLCRGSATGPILMPLRPSGTQNIASWTKPHKCDKTCEIYTLR